METGEQDARYQRARKRVEDLKGYYVHLTVYLIINFGLFLIDWLSGGGWWFFIPLLGWGVGLAIHTVVVFLVEGPTGRSWEERKIRKLMEEERGSGGA